MSENWWVERRQNEQLEQLQSEMSYALQQASRLQSQLSRLQGGLQDRVNRLSTAFDAFVELSDLRYEMAGFLDEAELRRYATRVLSAMASGTQLPPVGEPVPQYWLGPATQALIALHSSEPDEQAVSTAMTLDQRRTSIFLSLALAALGQRHQVQSEWLDVAFGVPATDGTLTRVQRVLWTTAARGGFGADGMELVVKRLQSSAPPEEGWLPKLEKPGKSARASEPPFEAVAEQEHARTRLARVRTAVEKIAGNTEAREPDPSLGYSEGEQDNAAGLLRLLISEGSEPEREPLARAAVLRAQISGSDDAAAKTIEDSVGTVEKLLSDDLNQSDDPYLSLTALRVVGPSVLPAAEELSQVASRPSPTEITLESERHTITIRPDGPDQLELNKAMSSIKQSAGVISSSKLAVAAVLGGVGAVMAIGLGFVNTIWIVFGLLLLGIGVFRYWNLRTTSKNDKAAAEERATRLSERCTAAVTQLAEYTSATESRQTGITTDLATIRDHLTS